MGHVPRGTLLRDKSCGWHVKNFVPDLDYYESHIPPTDVFARNPTVVSFVVALVHFSLLFSSDYSIPHFVTLVKS